MKKYNFTIGKQLNVRLLMKKLEREVMEKREVPGFKAEVAV